MYENYTIGSTTDADLSASNMRLEDTIEMKKYTYYVETGIFYFIAFLYILAFTLDSDTRRPRLIMLIITAVFLLYELYMH